MIYFAALIVCAKFRIVTPPAKAQLEPIQVVTRSEIFAYEFVGEKESLFATERNKYIFTIIDMLSK